MSGLPWAKSWGGYLKVARRATGKPIVHEDWTTGRSSEIAQRLAIDKNSLAVATDEHSEHTHHGGMAMPMLANYAPLDRMLGPVSRLQLAFPVLISPPMRHGGPWTAKSNSQDRVLRDQVTLDPATGAVLTRLNFSQRPLNDRLVGIGIAAHEGHLYGWLNQVVNLCTAIGLMVLSISAVILWWRRRPDGVLGAPVLLSKPQFTSGLVAIVLALAIYLPLFGLSLLLVLIAERLVLRRLPAMRHWLGLAAPSLSQM